jgi:hypothetical protein
MGSFLGVVEKIFLEAAVIRATSTNAHNINSSTLFSLGIDAVTRG